MYSGDQNYLGSLDTINITLNPPPRRGASLQLTPSSDPAGAPGPVTYTATVSTSAGPDTPSGTVVFIDGTAQIGTGTLSAGVASVSESNLAVGKHDIVAIYSGDDEFASSTSSVEEVIIDANGSSGSQSESMTNLSSSNSTSLLGQNVTFSTNVSPAVSGGGTPTGTVIFYDGLTQIGTGTLDGTGHASITVNNLTVGSHEITVIYSGDTAYIGSNSSLVQNVIRWDSSVGLSSSTSTADFGQPITFTASVSSNQTTVIPSGTIDFYYGSTVPLGTATLNTSGNASISLNMLPVGSNSITAVYGGDPNFNGSNSSANNVSISQATPIMSLNATGGIYNGLPFPATVTIAGVATGWDDIPDVSLEDVTPTLAYYSGSAATGTPLSGSPVQAGTYTVVASFAGSPDYASATSTPVTFTVNQATPTITWTNPAPITYGTALSATQLNATTAPTVQGSFNYTPPAGTILGPGLGQTLSVTFTPTDTVDYTTATQTVTIDVNQDQSNTNLTSSNNASNLSQNVTFTATVTSLGPASVPPTGTVDFYDGIKPSNWLGSATLANGVATFTTNALSLGNHAITASYTDGDAKYLGSTSPTLTQTVNSPGTSALAAQPAAKTSTRTVLTSSKRQAPLGTPVTFTATILPASSSTHTPTGTVEFWEVDRTTGANIRLLGTATLDGTGHASLTISSLTRGIHRIKAVYLGDASFAAGFGLYDETIT
jgi:hypothetical protein